MAAFRAEGRIKVDAEIVHGDSEAARDGWFKPGAGKTDPDTRCLLLIDVRVGNLVICQKRRSVRAQVL
jgi:hypothetical protein